MRVYFNNNSFTCGEPLMDVFSKAVSGCRSKGRAEQAQLPLGVRDWSCTSQYQQDHVLFSTPSHVLSSTSSVMPVFSVQFAQLTNHNLSPGFFAVISMAQPKHMPRCSFSSTSQPGISNSQFMVFQHFGWVWTPLLFSLLNSKHLPSYSQNSEPASQATPHYFWLNQPMRGVFKSYLETGKLPKEVEVRFAVGQHPKNLGISPEFI